MGGGGGGGVPEAHISYLCVNFSVEGGQTQNLSSPFYVILPLTREIPLGSPPLHALIIFSPS
jgi:hypothetical protein